MSPRNELTSIIYGLLLVFLMHLVAVVAIFLIGSILQFTGNSPYIGLRVFVYAGQSFPLIQLLYIIPAILRLKQQQRWGMMKGVIIGAILTVFLSGGCWLWFSGALS